VARLLILMSAKKKQSKLIRIAGIHKIHTLWRPVYTTIKKIKNETWHAIFLSSYKTKSFFIFLFCIFWRVIVLINSVCWLLIGFLEFICACRLRLYVYYTCSNKSLL
jgi:hypothetical protein